MARYPHAKWLPLDRYKPGGTSNRKTSGQRRLILHTAVSGADSLFPQMNVPGTPSSHFYVRQDGTVEQYIDTAFESSANLDGNPDCVTVESWDGGTVRAWTPAQVEACAQLAAWCHTEHGIPLVRLPSSRPGTSGVGWHRQGIDGNFPPGLLSGRPPDGEHWSTSAGKLCPGDPKIHGVVDDILPRAIEIASGDDMSAADVKAINDNTDAGIQRLAELVNARAKAERDRDAADTARDKATVDKIIAAVNAIPTSTGDPTDFRQAVLDVLDKQLALPEATP